MNIEFWKYIIVILSFILNVLQLIWRLLSKEKKEKIERKIFRCCRSKPYHYSKDLDTRESYSKIQDNVNRKNFIIRFGGFSPADKDYKDNITWAIKNEYIWDWHFFLMNKQSYQASNWLVDFFDTDSSNKIVKVRENTTTQLSVIEKNSLFENKDMFKKYKIEKTFTDIVIIGLIKHDEFLEISDFRKDENWENDKVIIDDILIYNQDKIEHIEIFKNEIAKSIIDTIVESYDKEKILFIPKNEVVEETKCDELIKYLNKELLKK